MNLKAFLKNARRLSQPYRVTDGASFRLDDLDPADTQDWKDKRRAKDALESGIDALSDYQEMLYAQDRWAVLVIFQAMDAAGKDSAVEHVMSGVNPQGCQVFSFKAPSEEELDHDFLWRCTQRLPERGRIGIFNRSYYEETLVVRVHPELLARQRLPPGLVTDDIWQRRFEDIRNLESYLARNGVAICKFFLNMSKEEQRQRFLDRLSEPDKHWKFSLRDLEERAHWDDYRSAYEDVIRHTSTPEAPWYVVPADKKWFTRVVVAAAIVDLLGSLDLHFPKLDAVRRAELRAAKRRLERE